jgi:hypothetical protein
MPSDRARACGHRDRIEIGEANTGLAACPLDRRDHRLQVRAAGHLGHDTAEPRMRVNA